MYNKPDIKEILNNLMDKDDTTLTDIVNTIAEFSKDVDDEIIREVFKTPEVDEMGEKLGLWKINEDFYFGSKDADEDIAIEKLFNVLRKVIETNDLTNEEKEEFIFAFADYFADCSDNEDFCERKVYVIIKNIGKDANDESEDDYSIVEEFSDIDDAESYVDDTYIGCCDDTYFAEMVWFQLLSYIQSNEWDTLVNFCKVFEFDAKGIEDGREDWEKENCEYDEDDE